MDSQSVLDLEAALDRFDGDRELFLTLAAMFVERAERTLAAIHTALTAADFPRLLSEAHQLKGSALEFCAYATADAATRLEASARGTAVEDVAAICERLQAETRRLIAELKEILHKGFSS